METINPLELKKQSEALLNASPNFIQNYIYLHAYLFPRVHRLTGRPPPEFHNTAQKVEKIVEDAYPMKVISFDSEVNEPIKWPQRVSRYCGLIKAISESGIESDILLGSHHVPREKDEEYFSACLYMRAGFQVDGYMENTRKALIKLWPLLRGFEFSTPKIPRGADTKNFQKGLIVLVKNRKTIATGFPCFKELGLNSMKLGKKDIFLLDGRDMHQYFSEGGVEGEDENEN